nr:ribonuclease H-like domain-containing protein [Tanacetum cinerariifolium]
MPITSVEDKAQRRLEVKARSTLMMGVPNKHQLKFNYIKDAKQLMEAIEKRFGRNAATKKTQRNLLKQQYENFTASNSEMLDQTIDILQNLNKADLDTMSMSDLYNNLKVYKPEVKGMSSSSTSTHIDFVSSSNNNSTNRAVNTTQAVNAAIGVSTAVTQVNAAIIDNLSDAVICAFLASQPSSPKLVIKDLEHIQLDDLKDMDLKWQMTMLTMRARRPKAVVNVVKGNHDNAVKASTCWVWKPKTKLIDHVSKHNSASITVKKIDYVDAQGKSKSDEGVIDSGCSRHMTKNMSYLTDYEEIDGGYVAFGGNPKGEKITGKGSGQNWLFDIDALTRIMNYKLIAAGTQSNGFVVISLSRISSSFFIYLLLGFHMILCVMEMMTLTIGRIEGVFGMSSNMMRQLPSESLCLEAFEDLIMNFILNQEERELRNLKSTWE